MEHEPEVQKKSPSRKQRIAGVLVPPLAHHWHRRYHRRSVAYFFDTLLAFALFSLLGINVFLLTTRDIASLLPTPKMTCALPEGIRNGVEFSATCTVQNTSGDRLENVTVQPLMPKYGTLASTSPALQKGLWHLGELRSGEKRDLHFSSVVFGTPNTSQELRFLLSTTVETTQLSSINRFSFSLQPAHVSVRVAAPATIQSALPTTILVTVTNNEQTNLAHVRVTVTLPNEFTAEKEFQTLANNTIVEDLNRIVAGQEKVFSVQGHFLAETTAHDVVRASVGLVQPDKVELEQASASTTVTVTPPPTITDIVNGTGAENIQLTAEAHYYSGAGTQFGFGPLPPKVGATTGYRIFLAMRTLQTDLTNIVVEAQVPAETQWVGNASVTQGSAIVFDAKQHVVQWKLASLPAGHTVALGSFDVSVIPDKADIGHPMILLSATSATATDPIGGKITLSAGQVTTALHETAAVGKGTVLP